MMTHIEIYVQISMSAELYGTLTVWNETQKQRCQEIANNMKAEVRAMQNNSVIGVFRPERPKLSEEQT